MQKEYHCDRCNNQIDFINMMGIGAKICPQCMDVYTGRKTEYFAKHPEHTLMDFYQAYRQSYPDKSDQVYFVPYTIVLKAILKKIEAVATAVRDHSPHIRNDSGQGMLLDEMIWDTLQSHGLEQPGHRVIQRKFDRPYVSKPRHTNQSVFEVWKIHDTYDRICNIYANRLIQILGISSQHIVEEKHKIRDDFGETYFHI